MHRASLILHLNPLDSQIGCSTGRAGPSYDEDGDIERKMLPVMLDHIIKTFFPEIWEDILVDADQVGPINF
jgi:hypothetical protein